MSRNTSVCSALSLPRSLLCYFLAVLLPPPLHPLTNPTFCSRGLNGNDGNDKAAVQKEGLQVIDLAEQITSVLCRLWCLRSPPSYIMLFSQCVPVTKKSEKKLVLLSQISLKLEVRYCSGPMKSHHSSKVFFIECTSALPIGSMYSYRKVGG